ncbi:MAG: response regulator [Synergistaceae bacterium]|jgi:signal transduction histidine kinase/FixJ family two-component response regulator/HPt (histidine-containing phosphotransfer) domain-containing protein|nr:response regulator [Synergistaceae bacterium]
MNLSIRTKLIASFSAIVLLNVCFGLYAIYSLSAINSRVESADSWSVVISQLSDLERNMTTVRRYDIGYVVTSDPRTLSLTMQRRASAIKNVDEYLQSYRNDVMVIWYDTEEQRKEDLDLVTVVINHWEAYLSFSRRIIALRDAGRDADVIALVNGDSRSAFESLVAQVETLIKFNRTGSEMETKESARIYDATRKAIAAILALFSAFSLLVTVLLTTGIKRSIDELLRVSIAVGEGNFDVEARVFSNDELGILSKQYNSMTGHLKSLVCEIKNQKNEAEHANLTKSRFLASMSHEIRTPMNAIIGMSDLMRTDNLDEVQRGYFSDIRQMSRALLQIINDILDFSKIEAGKMDLVPSDFNLRRMMDNVCSMGRYLATAKNLEFRYAVDDDVLQVVYADEVRVRQIVTNIMNNAIKYTDDGFVEVRVGRGEWDGRDCTVFAVSDSGRGIKEEDFPRLFGVFEQFDQEKNRSITGTGLGLSITKQLVNMMNGHIEVKSRYGNGSEFTVHLPLAEGDSARIEIGHDAYPFVVAKDASVLVVDDNSVNLTVARGFLKLHGIDADTAASGEEAIEKVRTKRYNMVLMDHMMPGMDGIEATRRIRALGGDCETLPVVALSANAVSSAVEAYFEAGMNGFIAKPIEAEKLNAALAKWLPSEKMTTRDPEKDEGREEKGGYEKLMGELLTVDCLDTTKGLLYTGGDRGMYIRVLRQFCEEAVKSVEALRSLAASRNWEEYSVRVHGMKSVLTNIGAGGRARAAYRLEMASKARSEAMCLAGTDPLCNSILALRDHLLRTSLMAEDEAEKLFMGAEVLAEKLEHLKKSCLEGKIEETNAAVSELKRVVVEGKKGKKGKNRGEKMDEAGVAKIVEALKSYDYEAAIGQIDEMIARLRGKEE